MTGLASTLVGGAIGFLSALAVGYLLQVHTKRGRRQEVLSLLRRELDEFANRLLLPALDEGELSLVSTVNVTLLERAFVEDVWDYNLDRKLVGILADVIERVKRYNDNVHVVNSFTFGMGLSLKPVNADDWNSVEIQRQLHGHLQASLSVVGEKVEDLMLELDQILATPGEGGLTRHSTRE